MRQIKPKVRLGTGIIYSKMGYNMTFGGVDLYGDPVSMEYKFFRNFIEIPLKLSLKINDNTESLYLFDVNIINQVFISEYSKSLNDNPSFYSSFSDLRKNEMKVYNIAIQAGITYQKSFNSNLYLKISPFIKYSIFSLNNIHDCSAGIKIGIGRNF
jgi:hypothetical protein